MAGGARRSRTGEVMNLDELEELERRATPGPWACRWIGGLRDVYVANGPDDLELLATRDNRTGADADVKLVVALRNQVRELVAEVRMLREERMK